VSDEGEPGLRERKRRATRRAILLAAIGVVRERGLEGTTVDEISRIADISPRTFFNYFPTKEDAILGEGPELDPAYADEFIADRGPILEAMARVFSASMTPVFGDPELAQLRREIMRTHPELAARRMATIYRFDVEATDLVRRRLIGEHPELARDERVLHERARLVALVSIAAMRHAWTTWGERADDAADSLADRMHESFHEIGELIESASAP
jgi:AcrR family transcriptional regulator